MASPLSQIPQPPQDPSQDPQAPPEAPQDPTAGDPTASDQPVAEMAFDPHSITSAIEAGCEFCQNAAAAENSEAYSRFAAGVLSLAQALTALTTPPTPPPQPGGKPQASSNGQGGGSAPSPGQ